MSRVTPLKRRAFLDSLPLFVPAIPFGMVVGLTITETGMNRLIGWSSAPLIFAGAAQLTLISLLGSGTVVAAAVTAALVVNARHIMYSAALAPMFQRQPRWFRWVGPYFLIDQMFALVSIRMEDDADDFRTYYLAAGFTFSFFWVVTVAVGLVLGPVIPDSWNLEFAVSILFLALIIVGIDRWPKLVAALTAAGTTYLTAGLPNRSALLVGSVAGIAVGTVVERFRK